MALELERHLVLNKYFLHLFGAKDFNDIRMKLWDISEEGYERGRSYFIDVLIGLKPDCESQLLRYDEAIREYTERLRNNRMQHDFTLKYFQYLAVLFTEIFLDKYHNEKERNVFLNELNTFLNEFNDKNGTEITPFTEEDLKKLAFWMATGSGKTLIMHINYWQILRYSNNDWDNIILITPNEGLSDQHYRELVQSGIPCELYDGNAYSIGTNGEKILVIDIHKLTKEKKGEGVSVDVSSFDGKNLVFIDEGHKGQKSEEQKWKRLREEIGKNGFIFEYSATFGQIIGKNKDLLDEYSKSIIFDYSYKYFYTDGYGKDFYVYNIKEDIYSDEQRSLLLTAGLLSFYEQLEIFEKEKDEIRKYNIEKPLWVFVGSKVAGKGINSDVVRVIKFLNKVLSNENYLKENVKKILARETGLVDELGNDIFEGKFEYIRKLDIDYIIDAIYRKVFYGKGTLELYELKEASGEIGLKTSITPEGNYFGVINVGDVGSLKKLIPESGQEIKKDNFTPSLFSEINENDSQVNLLIGSKKFIEGWDSYRVSNMGLINMGKGEGPQIIQLFGRGVRLKGENNSLKREENPSYEVQALQTLFVFGLNADYVNAFLSAMDKEGVNYEEREIEIEFNRRNEWENSIYTIKTRDDFDFLDYPVELKLENDILRKITIDLRPKIEISRGSTKKDGQAFDIEKVKEALDEPLNIPNKYLESMDWDYIYGEIMNYKIEKKMFNLILKLEVIKEVIKSKEYKVFLRDTEGIRINEDGDLKITSFKGIIKFQQIILMIIKSYIQKFYGIKEKEKTMENLEVEPLTVDKHSYMYPENRRVIVKVPKELVKDFEKIIEDKDKWKNWSSFVVDFDKHLYTPLIVFTGDKYEKIKSIPVKLNEGETTFLKDFEKFLNSNIIAFRNKSVFLLRNLSKRSVGFFTKLSGFYPDFIVWTKEGNKQCMTFIEPKGIMYIGNFKHPKIEFCKTDIKEVEETINKRLEEKGEIIKLQLDAFIVSVTEYEKIRDIWKEGRFTNKGFKEAEKDFFEHNIVFQKDDRGYIRKIFKK